MQSISPNIEHNTEVTSGFTLTSREGKVMNILFVNRLPGKREILREGPPGSLNRFLVTRLTSELHCPIPVAY